MPDDLIPPGAPLTQTQGTGLPLPAGADLAFWKTEIERSQAQNDTHTSERQENLDYYTGRPLKNQPETDYVNVNVDFYQVEQKAPQLFFDTPDLRLEGKGALKGQTAIVQAHRALLNELLGPTHADVLRTVQKCIKECLCTAGTGPAIVGFQPTVRQVPAPVQPGAVLGLNQSQPVVTHQQFYIQPFSSAKLLVPADFKDTDWDRAPWLGMKFRMPLALARKEFTLPPDFVGTTVRDEATYDGTERASEVSGLNYVDGTVIWYRAAYFDDQPVHPELFRELVIIDTLDKEARHRDSPHQTVLPTGQLSADSLIGNPISPLTIRDVPDSAFVPSDSQMTRPLVKELCKFRSQMVKQRDASKQRVLYDSDKFDPETVDKMVKGDVGDLIPVIAGALTQGIASIMAPVSTGTEPRQTYLANDYITRDIEKTLAVDAAGAGVAGENDNESATKTAVVDRNRNVRLSHEQRQVLRWYLKLVMKFSALVCRYMLPAQAVAYIGAEQAQAWSQWDKQSIDGRLVIDAKPDSQIHLDAAQQRKYWLDLYQFTAKDPNVVRVSLLKKLFEVAGENPADFVVDQLPEQKPDPNIGYSFKGEDLIGPQAPMVLEILAQAGIQISQHARDDSAGQLFKQMALGIRDASGKAVPPTPRPQGHGGPADQVRPLSKQSADQSGDRSGPKAAA